MSKSAQIPWLTNLFERAGHGSKKRLCAHMISKGFPSWHNQSIVSEILNPDESRKAYQTELPEIQQFFKLELKETIPLPVDNDLAEAQGQMLSQRLQERLGDFLVGHREFVIRTAKEIQERANKHNHPITLEENFGLAIDVLRNIIASDDFTNANGIEEQSSVLDKYFSYEMSRLETQFRKPG